jgi:hypothetical protein
VGVRKVLWRPRQPSLEVSLLVLYFIKYSSSKNSQIIFFEQYYGRPVP